MTPSPTPGLRLLRRRDDHEWSVYVLGISPASRPAGHGGRVEYDLVETVHEASGTMGGVDAVHWPNCYDVRVMGPDEPVVGEGLNTGSTPLAALRMALARYRCPDWTPIGKAVAREAQRADRKSP